MARLILRVNITSDTNQPYSSHPANYKDMAPEDYLIFSKGSDKVANGEPIPSEDDLDEAATRIEIIEETEIPKCFLAKVSENKLYEIPGANSGNHQKSDCNNYN